VFTLHSHGRRLFVLGNETESRGAEDRDAERNGERSHSDMEAKINFSKFVGYRKLVHVAPGRPAVESLL